MSRNIRLFPTYSQKENQTTNHCLLILKMLYEENPKFLSEVLSGLLGENFSGTVGVQFTQQRRVKESVPDGEILYFGTYRNKCVEQIAQIEAVVDLESEDEATIVWRNDSRTEQELVEIAIERRQKIGDSWYPVRIFVLGDMYSTNFVKASSGGMFVSKQYFDIAKLKVSSAEDLAAKLREKTWENYVMM
jgi:hypothetical protein